MALGVSWRTGSPSHRWPPETRYNTYSSTETHMIKTLATVTAALALLINPAGATPERRIVNPGELMVLVPGLEGLGYSRISTVEHCAAIVGVEGDGWMELVTDAEFEGMELCLQEHT